MVTKLLYYMRTLELITTPRTFWASYKGRLWFDLDVESPDEDFETFHYCYV